MLDSKKFFSKLEDVEQRLSERGFILNREEIIKLKKEEKILETEINSLRIKRNLISKTIGIEKRISKNVNILHIKAKKISEELSCKALKLKTIKSKIREIFSEIPNLPEKHILSSNRKKDDIEIKRWGKKRKFNFKIKNHIELTKKNKNIDFAIAAKISKSKFSVISGSLARLYRALSQFMIDLHVDQHGYYEVLVPYIVNYQSLYHTGHLPKFMNDLFSIKLNKNLKENHEDYFLVPTGEVPMVNLVQDKIFSYESLPIKLISNTACFRLEAGSYGKKTRGLIRSHQFDKVELVQIVQPEKSRTALEELTSHAEKILELLKLPYRKLILHSENLGFSSSKTYDLEVWFPSQKKYIEISSCSNTTDFQSRRMNTKFKKGNDRSKQLVHILNGSGLPIGRTMAAILENYQMCDGSIKIPEILKRYMNELDQISLDEPIRY
ncbi:serine--tRNA ligase [Candidatus Riesia pediculicola]|mgnify:FL=1|uniref:serine--tRNA ligase n=1 Tax=Candidatus Riesia pediculicola TaxID=401619 RepID=UPI0009B7616A|nr:serine--tRNA ligase [Candidatus Riesia pediculicola]ARC53710.1 serine--tRNA ligase [Candidatus Riesia pediculicola]